MVLIIILVVVALAVLASFSNKVNVGGRKSPVVYHYGRKEFLMNRAEHEFFDMLVNVVGSDYYVFPQVHLSTILDHKIKGQDWGAAFRHINQKSVDFVICDKAYIKPLVAIELDGRSHDEEAVQQRDETKRRIFEDAGLKLIRFTNHGMPNGEDVRQRVAEALLGK